MTDLIQVNFSKAVKKSSDTLVVGVLGNKALPRALKDLDKDLFDYVAYQMDEEKSFKAKLGNTLTLSAPKDSIVKKIIILGLGDKKELNGLKAEEAGGKLFPVLKSVNAQKAALISAHGFLEYIANGCLLRSYDFNIYKSKKNEDGAQGAKILDIIDADSTNIKKKYTALNCAAQGTIFARDLVNEPPNVLYPDSYAKRIKEELKPLGVQVEIFDEKKMAKLGMGAALAVGQGSDNPPRIVVMRWNGAGSKAKSAKPLAFVGKGVTFDTGGISLKPGAAMDEMKMDMGGSAAVVGLMKTLALRGAKANVVAVVGLAENMPSSKAYRPGDIITSYAGKTIEVLNTDAEGRLVLVDCLAYVQKTYKPEFVINLATLTGAMMVALGHEYCGTYANDDKLWSQMEKSSAASGEKLWRMPLDEVWKKDVESDIADVRNLAKSGRYGGANTAAAFLEHFIEEDMSWSHMDIAGTAWRKSDQPTCPKFGTGFGVRVLNQLIADHYEG